MTNFEMVERLRAKANVSYEEAKDALEKSNWDLLEAMVLLEKQGKVNEQGAEYTTREEPRPENEHSEHNFKRFMVKLGGIVTAALNYLNRNALEITRKEKVVLTLPLTVMILLLVFLFFPTIILLIIGLFTGFRYAFRGPDLEKDYINSAMDKASNMAENLKDEVKNEYRNKNEDDSSNS